MFTGLLETLHLLDADAGVGRVLTVSPQAACLRSYVTFQSYQGQTDFKTLSIETPSCWNLYQWFCDKFMDDISVDGLQSKCAA